MTTHDVFLSFRGKDTRHNFMHKLYTALLRSQIRTFMDDDKLPRGHEISLQLLKAIEESRIAIVILSQNYADSRWCLSELVKIIDCKNTTGLLVFPVFYAVDPSAVSRQTGSFAAAFESHEKRYGGQMRMVDGWRDVLREVANLPGWRFPSGSSSGQMLNSLTVSFSEIIHQQRWVLPMKNPYA